MHKYFLILFLFYSCGTNREVVSCEHDKYENTCHKYFQYSDDNMDSKISMIKAEIIDHLNGLEEWSGNINPEFFVLMNFEKHDSIDFFKCFINADSIGSWHENIRPGDCVGYLLSQDSIHFFESSCVSTGSAHYLKPTLSFYSQLIYLSAEKNYSHIYLSDNVLGNVSYYAAYSEDHFDIYTYSKEKK